MKVDHKRIAKFYDEEYYRDFAKDVGIPARHLVNLTRRLGIKRDEKILDVACGTGEWLSAVNRCGAAVAGIDISSRAIEICAERLPHGSFFSGVAENLPFSDAEFDVVTCLGSLEHFVDQIAALKEMVRVIKPDGRILILVPNAGFLTYRLGLYRGTNQQAIRETILPLPVWGQMFGEAGLNVVDRWRDLHVLSRNWIFCAPLILVPFRLLQAVSLFFWPIAWQYQVYHLCRPAQKISN